MPSFKVKQRQVGSLILQSQKGLSNIEFIIDSVSGKTPWRERKLGAAIEQMQMGDNLVFAEILRMARSTLQVLEILSACADKEIKVYIAKQQMHLMARCRQRSQQRF